MNQPDLAKDCKAFYEKRLRLTHSVEHKWTATEPGEASSSFSKLPNQIAQLRSELLSLAHLDNELFKNLLALNDKLEELKLDREQASSSSSEAACFQSSSGGAETAETTTTEEYSDEDIDEEVNDDFHHFYTSLPPSQILERAAVMADQPAAAASSSSPSSDDHKSENNGLDVMGGLKLMLRSRSFLLRPPFHKKTDSQQQQRRSRLITSPDSPFRTFDRIQENRVTEHKIRSHSAERRKKRPDPSKLEAGSSATLTRGFHLPHSSKSLWQRVFVGSSAASSTAATSSTLSHHHHYNNNGPESLPCSWGVIDLDHQQDKSPTLKHIKQSSFDSGIHTTASSSDSSEYSIKI